MHHHRFRFKDVINLAAPHTWAGSVGPAVVGLAISYHAQGFLDPLMAFCTFFIVIMMQSAVNTFDDYSDFVKGTDTLENSPEAYDAVIVHGMKPGTALLAGFVFLLLGAVPGVYVVMRCGWVPLAIGLAGTAVLFWYAFGKHPLCYTPLGEVFCGFVMGGLIPLATFYMQTGRLYWFVLVEALPPILGMAVNMFSNNGCDIARDLPAGRKTLACLLGQKRTDRLYRILLLVWVSSPVVVLGAQGSWSSVLIYVLASLAYTHLILRQYRHQLGPEARPAVMLGATTLVTLVAFSYSMAMIMG